MLPVTCGSGNREASPAGTDGLSPGLDAPRASCVVNPCQAFSLHLCNMDYNSAYFTGWPNGWMKCDYPLNPQGLSGTPHSDQIRPGLWQCDDTPRCHIPTLIVGMIQVLSGVISASVETNTSPGQSHYLGPNLLNLWAWFPFRKWKSNRSVGGFFFSSSLKKKTKTQL